MSILTVIETATSLPSTTFGSRLMLTGVVGTVTATLFMNDVKIWESNRSDAITEGQTVFTALLDALNKR